MANDSDACVPQTLTDFVFDLYDSVTLSQLTEEQSRLYSTVFRDLSSKVCRIVLCAMGCLCIVHTRRSCYSLFKHSRPFLNIIIFLFLSTLPMPLGRLLNPLLANAMAIPCSWPFTGN
jgi:hypothetical protein